MLSAISTATALSFPLALSLQPSFNFRSVARANILQQKSQIGLVKYDCRNALNKLAPDVERTGMGGTTSCKKCGGPSCQPQEMTTLYTKTSTANVETNGSLCLDCLNHLHTCLRAYSGYTKLKQIYLIKST